MFSHHANIRNQQRCIPPIVHMWLSEFGDEIYDRNGGIKVFFSSKSKKRMEHKFGRHFIRENSKYLTAYRVESSSDGKVITSGWINKRINKYK